MSLPLPKKPTLEEQFETCAVLNGSCTCQRQGRRVPCDAVIKCGSNWTGEAQRRGMENARAVAGAQYERREK